MFIEVPDLLTAAQVQRVKELAGKAKFVDGRVSNPHSDVKKNLQIDFGDPHFQEASRIVADALMQNETVQNYALVSRFAPPLICRYRSGMSYGRHYDSAFLPLRPTPLRSDLSSTIFLSEPETYEGGELRVELASKHVLFKGSAGSAILYPSTSIHEVRPVTSGERLVAITFIESRIKDENERYLLYSLNEIAALEGFNISEENRMRLQHICANLERKWSN
jgi:PKHD-type hydroxylase